MSDVSTRERAGAYDGLENAKPGEPIFTLQGGDPFAPPTILHWAGLARAAGLQSADKAEAARLLRKAASAEEAAWAFVDYQKGAEPLAGSRASYSGAEDDDRKLEIAGLAAVADHIYNAVAHLADAADGLKALQACPEAEVALREALEPINEAVRAVEPRRHLRRRQG
ncbi:hypothetical protein KNJ79_02235 [Sphingopyxis indica]|uniref:hypothetical protein n=1 Tax=Sphingopyxis indica TaxID=436663 RepID=UPI0029393FBB|nr:hypothetical protein [Sphingopyxis indica]WOF43804.1 hypothetical protein KNJ79_02235 [Sphingopyxis indica]